MNYLSKSKTMILCVGLVFIISDITTDNTKRSLKRKKPTSEIDLQIEPRKRQKLEHKPGSYLTKQKINIRDLSNTDTNLNTKFSAYFIELFSILKDPVFSFLNLRLDNPPPQSNENSQITNLIKRITSIIEHDNSKDYTNLQMFSPYSSARFQPNQNLAPNYSRSSLNRSNTPTQNSLFQDYPYAEIHSILSYKQSLIVLKLNIIYLIIHYNKEFDYKNIIMDLTELILIHRQPNIPINQFIENHLNKLKKEVLPKLDTYLKNDNLNFHKIVQETETTLNNSINEISIENINQHLTSNNNLNEIKNIYIECQYGHNESNYISFTQLGRLFYLSKQISLLIKMTGVKDIVAHFEQLNKLILLILKKYKYLFFNFLSKEITECIETTYDNRSVHRLKLITPINRYNDQSDFIFGSKNSNKTNEVFKTETEKSDYMDIDTTNVSGGTDNSFPTIIRSEEDQTNDTVMTDESTESDHSEDDLTNEIDMTDESTESYHSDEDLTCDTNMTDESKNHVIDAEVQNSDNGNTYDSIEFDDSEPDQIFDTDM